MKTLSVPCTPVRFSLLAVMLGILSCVCYADAPGLMFDARSGIVSLTGCAGQEVGCTVKAGALEFSAGDWHASSDRRSADFAPSLADIDVRTLKGIQAGDGILELSGLTSDVPLHFEASEVHIKGSIHAPSITVMAQVRLVIEGGVNMSAARGSDGGSIDLLAPIILTGGTLDAHGENGGSIYVSTTNMFNYGSLLADGTARGGSIDVRIDGHYSEVEAARLSVKCDAGAAGSITLNGASKGTIFSSASMNASGDRGGEIRLLGTTVTLAAAHLDASGNAGGGTVLIGGDRQGANAQVANAKNIHLNHATEISANALKNGNGGKIVCWSDGKSEIAGKFNARGGAQGGDGGFIEASGKGELAYGALADAGSPHGKAGTLLLDPKFIIVAASGSLLQFELVDPEQSAAKEAFGIKVLPLATGNVVVIDPGNVVNGASAGAIHLFNGKTGALLRTIHGAAAGDTLGAFGDVNNGFTGMDMLNAKVAAYIVSPKAFAGKGALTFVDGSTPVTPPVTATISGSNSILGLVANDFPANTNPGPVKLQTLGNGNMVLAAPSWNSSRGFVMLLSGSTALLPFANGQVLQPTTSNCLTSNSANASVGVNIYDLGNGNFTVLTISPGGVASEGAMTWCDGVNGTQGVVSAANSLVGTQNYDNVGFSGVKVLPNGNYVVISNNFGQGGSFLTPKGAVTFVNGSTGLPVGAVSTANSLVGAVGGTALGDRVGGDGVMVLNNSSNFVVISSNWNNYTGAVTWGSGTTGVVGLVGSNNSMIGATSGTVQNGLGDYAGSGGVLLLTNGNYVVISPNFNGGSTNGRGATTLCNGATGGFGTISSGNSLVGSTAGDKVGTAYYNCAALSNGNYVVCSPNWTNVTGAATFCSGNAASPSPVGAVTSSNSLVGSAVNDRVGSQILPLVGNGSYLVISNNWNGNRGAATWGGPSGVTGVVSALNSLIGLAANDGVGSGQNTALKNGNYVVVSPQCTINGFVGAGAVTFGDGSVGVKGNPATVNSLVGAATNDAIGSGGIYALPNSNYLVKSSQFNGSHGALTFANGATGVSGVVSGINAPINSLIFRTANDLSFTNNYALNGNAFAVIISTFDDPDNILTDVGAVIFSDGSSFPTGKASAANMLIGSNSMDQIGIDGVQKLANGNAAIMSPRYNSYAGAVTVVTNFSNVVGSVTAANSVTGAAMNEQFGQMQNSILLASGDIGVFDGAYANNGVTFVGAACVISGTTGKSQTGFGIVSPSNSLVGNVQFANCQGIVEDAVNGTLLGRWPGETSGKVRVALTNPAALVYGFSSSSSVTIASSFLEAALNAGTSIALQANDDITINNPIAVTGASAGTLTLQAGRSILINANITTHNAPLILTANDKSSSGVINAQRDAGNAVITMAASTALDAGTAALTAQVLDGAGNTNTGTGTLTLQTVKAASATLTNLGTAGGSGIVANDLRVTNNVTASTAAGGITLAAIANPLNVGAVTAFGNVLIQTTTSGPLALNGAITTNGGGTLTISHAGTFALNNTASINTAGAFSESGAGAVTLNTGITTNNAAVSFQGPVTTPVNIAISAGSAQVSFASLDVGKQNLSVTGNFKVSTQFSTTLAGTGAGQHGVVSVVGTVQVAGGISGTLANGFNPAAGVPLTLIDNDAADAVTGTFTGIVDGGTVVFSGTSLVLKYTGGTGNDIDVAVQGSAGNHPPVIMTGPSALPAAPAVAQSVNFSVTATDQDNDPLTYSWDFADGNTATGATPAHAFAAGGTFNVVVSVTDGKSPPVTGMVTVVVGGVTNHPPQITAGPTATPPAPAVAQAVAFSVAATDADSDPLTISWNFADGGTATGATPSHSFASAGTFTVVVSVTDGKSPPVTGSVNVVVGGSTNHPPQITAGPTATPPAANAGQPITFSVTATDADSDPLTISWDYANGATATGANPPPYAFPNPGTYNVTVSVTDGKSTPVTGSVSVTIGGSANHPPQITAGPTFTPPTPAIGQPVVFAVTAIDADGDPLTITWDFGDTATGTGAAPTHPYAAAGTYKVVVSVTDGKSTPVTATVNVIVGGGAGGNHPPVITSAAAAVPNPAGVGQVVTFTVAATDADSNPLTYTWDFGDGSTGAGASTIHPFASAGTYAVKVSVSDGIAVPIVSAVSVQVNAPLFGTGPDSDGDGFSDTLETVSGSDPNDPNSTPIGGPLTTGSVQALTLSKTLIKLSFVTGKPGDSITLSGKVSIPDGFAVNKQKVSFDIGGVEKGFVLDAKGSAKAGGDTFKMSIKLTKKVVKAQTVSFTATFTKGSFASALLPFGLVNADVKKGVSVQVPYTVLFPGAVLQKTVTLTYTAKKGKSGMAK